MVEPERLDADPAVAVVAFRFWSRSAPTRTYDVAIAPDGTASCECWPFLKFDRCAHIDTARQLLENERRAEERQAELDARLGCRHPLTVDEQSVRLGHEHLIVDRSCLGCGHSYERGAFLRRLEADIRERHRLPASPWTAAERSGDPS